MRQSATFVCFFFLPLFTSIAVKEWIVSPIARRVYRFSASISLALLLGFTAILIEGRFPEIDPSFMRTLALIGAIGAGITLVGMAYFLFRFDDSNAYKQVFWFCVMLLMPLLGVPLYYFIVYSRSHPFESHTSVATAGSCIS
jgi:hypothetical protein